MIKRLLFFLLSFLVSLTASLVATYLVVLRPMRRTWGTDPTESSRDLAGDDLIPEATLVETRGITIDAPASAVWPCWSGIVKENRPVAGAVQRNS